MFKKVERRGLVVFAVDYSAKGLRFESRRSQGIIYNLLNSLFDFHVRTNHDAEDFDKSRSQCIIKETSRGNGKKAEWTGWNLQFD